MSVPDTYEFFHFRIPTEHQLKIAVFLLGDFSCTLEVQRAIPILKKAYGDSMHKVLHVGPDTCSVVSQLFKEEETEAWGVEPYDIEDADGSCKRLVHKGIVRVADIKFPLPYRAKSFSLVIVSDALDYLSPKYLNKTLPGLARVSADSIVIFTGITSLRKLGQLDGPHKLVQLGMIPSQQPVPRNQICYWIHWKIVLFLLSNGSPFLEYIYLYIYLLYLGIRFMESLNVLAHLVPGLFLRFLMSIIHCLRHIFPNCLIVL